MKLIEPKGENRPKYKDNSNWKSESTYKSSNIKIVSKNRFEDLFWNSKKT